jgi:hypothetical protein
MKNRSMIGLQSRNLLLIFGTTVALFVSTSSSQMMSASVEGGSPGPNNSNSNQSALCEGCSPMDPISGGSSNPNQQAIDHINQAQSALQNGDTEGAQMHMDAAKQALDCNKIIDPNC